MKLSKLFVPTMREVPADADAVSHKLMLRAGYVRQLAAGLYILLPLGLRVMNKINTIMRQEMNAIGGQEISMPILHPAEVWQKTGRWYDIKDEMFRLKDRTDRDMCLGMTHEEIMTWLASREIRSYRNLPQVWYQIQTKLRDEARPKSGILRTREFIMKDSYSFDADEAGLDLNYRLHAEAYHRIFGRCGLTFYQVESDTGMMGGAAAHEFMAPSPAGEDDIVICNQCGYTANVEVARSVSRPVEEQQWSYEEVSTPGKKTVKEVAAFFSVSPASLIKSLAMTTPSGPVLVLLRGDQELHEKKLQKIVGPFRQASRDEVVTILGVEAGFIGPMGHKDIRIVADNALQQGTYIAGANKADYHAKGVTAGVHFNPEWHDLHTARAGDLCPGCNGSLRIEKAIEIGNIFKLGTKYSVPLEALFLDKEGQSRPIIMGSYGIGPARIAAAAIEQNNDKDGIIWPRAIAPFDIELIPLNVNDAGTAEITGSLSAGLQAAGLELLIDDRDERPGVKFKDADLIGIPLQVVIGEKGLKENIIEVKIRRSKETKKVPVEKAQEEIPAIYNEACL